VRSASPGLLAGGLIHPIPLVVQFPFHTADAHVQIIERGLGLPDGVVALLHRVILDCLAVSSTFLETSFAVVLLPVISAAKDNGETVSSAPSTSARTKKADMRIVMNPSGRKLFWLRHDA